MRTMNHIALILATGLTVVALPSGLEAQRTPLSTTELIRIPHEPTAPRHRYDAARHTLVPYEVDGRIEYRPSARDFVVSWAGEDGSRRTVVFEPRNKLSAVVMAEVARDEDTGEFIYTYSVTNLESSDQMLAWLVLEAVDVEGAGSPNDSWMSERLTDFVRRGLEVPGGWVWVRVFGGQLGIPPGATAHGFEVRSPNPPDTVRVFALGRRDALRSDEEIPEELHAAIQSVFFDQFLKGVTIGPKVPSTTESADAEFERLLSLLEAADEQGWMGPGDATASFRTALGTARSAALEGNHGVAAGQVASLLQAMEEGQYPGVLSEARGLFRYHLREAEGRLRHLSPSESAPPARGAT